MTNNEIINWNKKKWHKMTTNNEKYENDKNDQIK